MSFLLLLTGYLRLHSHQTNWILSAIYLQLWDMKEYGGGHFFFRTQSIIAEIHFVVYSHGHKGFCIMTCLHFFVSSVFYKTREMTSCDIEFSLESLTLQRIYRIPCTETAPCWSIVKTRNNTAKVQPYFFIYFPVTHNTHCNERSSIKYFFSQIELCE